MSKKDCMKGVKQSERSNKKAEYWKHLLDKNVSIGVWFILIGSIFFNSFLVLAVYNAFKPLDWLESAGVIAFYISSACALIACTFYIICDCRYEYWRKRAAIYRNYEIAQGIDK